MRHPIEFYYCGFIVFVGIFAIILLPVTRYFFRKWCASLGFWGEPFGLIGFGEMGSRIFNRLADHPELGLRPVAIINGFNFQIAPKVPIPYYSLGGEVDPERISSLTHVKTAILILSEVPTELREKTITGSRHEFCLLIVIPDGQFGSSVWIKALDIRGILGLEVRQKLLSRYKQDIKRALDIFLIVLASLWIVNQVVGIQEAPGRRGGAPRSQGCDIRIERDTMQHHHSRPGKPVPAGAGR